MFLLKIKKCLLKVIWNFGKDGYKDRLFYTYYILKI